MQLHSPGFTQMGNAGGVGEHMESIHKWHCCGWHRGDLVIHLVSGLYLRDLAYLFWLMWNEI